MLATRPMSNALPKYSLPENERRWRVSAIPTFSTSVHSRLIEDSYIDGSRLRLRRITDHSGALTYKLVKKYLPDADDAHAITNLYLSASEYALLSQLPAHRLRKRRYVQHFKQWQFAIDVFEDALAGLVLTETDQPSRAVLATVQPPPWAGAEVTEDIRFTGAALAQLNAQEVQRLLDIPR